MTPAAAAPPRPTGVHLRPTVTLDGRPLSMRLQEALTEVRISTAVRTVGVCVLRLADPDYEVARTGALVIGRTVTVSGRRDTAQARAAQLFTGDITGIALENDGRGRSELLVTVADRAHRLGRASRTTAYLESSYQDIVGQACRRSGLGTGSLGTGAVRPYVLQAGTDLDLVNELSGRLGHDWVVEGTDLSMWDPQTRLAAPPAAALTVGTDISELSVRLTSSATEKVTVRGRDPKLAEVVSADRTRTSHAPAELARLFSSLSLGSVTTLDTASSPISSQEADELAAAVLSTDGDVVLRGRLRFEPDLRPGRTVAITGAGPSDGTYYVREVVHTFTESEARTQVVAGDNPRTSLRDALGGRGRASSGFTHDGLVIGTVSDVDDTENLGRVKVTFQILSSEVTSDWARVASVGAGAGRGMLSLPEIGDEVLLGFEGADVRRPVVLSGLYGPKSPPPGATEAQQKGSVLNRAITSRLGHVVELGDGTAAADQHVLLALAGRTHRLRLGKDRAEMTVPDGVPLTITSGASTISIDASGAVSITGTTVTVAADSKLSLKAAEIEIAASAKVSVSGQVAELVGQATATVKASGTTSVSGGLVMIN